MAAMATETANAWVIIEVSLPYCGVVRTPRQLSCVDGALQAKLSIFSAMARKVAAPLLN
jgi:hypothetical protein